ncbi:uncharacterized protein LOC143259817 [Megalopta genalis]|uniref:uncharacterized protein LOC143259817 n=1 Tax=Megalopta genalis TaxID=115081 RepID=UPI003FD0D33F
MSPTIPPVLVLSLLLLSPAASEEAIDPFALIRESLKYWRRIYKMYQEEVGLGYCWAEYFLRLGQTTRNPPPEQTATPNVANFQINRDNLFVSRRDKRSHGSLDSGDDNEAKMERRITVTREGIERYEDRCGSKATQCFVANRFRRSIDRNFSNPPFCKFEAEVPKFPEKIPGERDVSAGKSRALGPSFALSDEKNHRLASLLAPLTATQRITVVTSGNFRVQSLSTSTKKSRERGPRRSSVPAEQDGADGGLSSSLKRVVVAPFVLEFKGTGAEGGPEPGWKLKGPGADTRRKVLRSLGSDGTSGFAFSLARSRPRGRESLLFPRRVVFVGDSRFKGRNAMKKLGDKEGREDLRRERRGEQSNVEFRGEERPRERHQKRFRRERGAESWIKIEKLNKERGLDLTPSNQAFQRRSLAFQHETPIWRRGIRGGRRTTKGNGSWKTRNDFGYFLESESSFSLKKRGFWPRERFTEDERENNWESPKQLSSPKDNQYRIGGEKGAGKPVTYPPRDPSLLPVTRQRFMGDYGSPTSGTSRNSIQSRSPENQGRWSLTSFGTARGLARMSAILYDLHTVFMAFLKVLRMFVELGWETVDYIETNMALACTKDYLVEKALQWIDS